MHAASRPKARPGLLLARHEKSGCRLFSVLDRPTARVVLLEPWEHAVLALCDGTRSPERIADELEGLDASKISQCLGFLENEGLFEASPVHLGSLVGLPAESGALGVGATVLVGRTGRARSLLEEDRDAPDGEGWGAQLGAPELGPTKASAGEIDEPIDVVELLRAVDSDLSAFDEQRNDEAPRKRPDGGVRAVGGEAILPESTDRPLAASKVVTCPPRGVPTVVAAVPEAVQRIRAGRCPRCAQPGVSDRTGPCPKCGFEGVR